MQRNILKILSFCLKSNSAIQSFYQKDLITHRTFKLKTKTIETRVNDGENVLKPDILSEYTKCNMKI